MPTATPAPTPTPTPSAWASYTQGIDISHWQGTIDWAKVAASGKRFAFIKASDGVRDAAGKMFVDTTYPTNRAQAKANGMFLGAYHFARPELTLIDLVGVLDPVPDAVAEADHFIDTATPRSGEMIPVLDLEDYGKTATNPGLSPTDLQTWVRAFLERVYERTGVRAAIYVSPSFWSTRMGNSRWFADRRLPDPLDRPLDLCRRPDPPGEQLGRAGLDVLAVHVQRHGPRDQRARRSRLLPGRRLLAGPHPVAKPVAGRAAVRHGGVHPA